MAKIVAFQGLRSPDRTVPFNTDVESLVPESQPALYFYQQQYSYDGKQYTKNGLMAELEFYPEQKGIIIPHQRAVPQEVEQQLELLTKDGVQVKPVQGLYTDFNMAVDKLIVDAFAKPADLELKLADSVIRLKVVTDAKLITQVQQALERQRIFIAAGEDIYYAMLQYAAEQPKPPKLLMALSNIYAPNLLIQPIHRLLRVKPFRLKKFIKQLKDELEVTEFAVHPDGSNLAEFLQQINPHGGQRLPIDHRRSFGIYAGGGKGYVVTLKDAGTMDRLLPRDGYTFALQGVDVFILHYGIFREIMGIGKEESKVEASIDYAYDAGAALAKVDGGQAELAFLINPVLRDELIAVAAGGELLPEKSTYFYPPFPAGLVASKL